MTTSDLISYIGKQIQNNTPKDLIISKLLSVGWKQEDIDEGFSSFDKYREPIEGDNIFDLEKEIPGIEFYNINGEKKEFKKPDSSIAEDIKREEPKTETVATETPKTEEPLTTEIQTFKEELPSTEALKTETPTIQKQELPIVESIKTEIPKMEAPKVWTPMRIPVKEISPEVKINSDIKKETSGVEIQNLELNTTKEELLPTLMPRTVVNSFGSIKKEEPVKLNTPIVAEELSKDSLSRSLPKIAMLSSYQKDLQSANITNEESTKSKSHKITKWIIISLAIIVIISGVLMLVGGYINIKNINFPFIKKDPKVLILNNSKVLASLESYKTETNIEISSPSFANISAGLIGGEAVSSIDKDTFTINTLGVINQTAQGLLSDNFVTIKSSILQDQITTDIKNDGTDLFITVLDLSQLIKEKIPESSVVRINEQQFELLPALFSPEKETLFKKINIYRLLSSGMSSYLNKETLAVYDSFINDVEITEKGQENIKGIDTYHYSINTDRQLAKNLLSKISNDFMLNLSEEDNARLSEILGSVTVNSLEVWVGKGDSNIYQYNVSLSIPLSKIIGFEDKSIGDNKVNIVWKTTYYDFNISNSIFVPEESTPALDFINNIKKEKIKNDVLSFRQVATNLYNSEGGYGVKSNPSGNCMSPTSGSLFSPLGHTKGSITAVSSISSALNKILGTTNNNGYCYSTPKAWSLTVPMSDNYDPNMTPEGGYTSFFCTDSTGFSSELAYSPKGVACLVNPSLPKVAN